MGGGEGKGGGRNEIWFLGMRPAQALCMPKFLVHIQNGGIVSPQISKSPN